LITSQSGFGRIAHFAQGAIRRSSSFARYMRVFSRLSSVRHQCSSSFGPFALQKRAVP
jgi:hypothetical protein